MFVAPLVRGLAFDHAGAAHLIQRRDIMSMSPVTTRDNGTPRTPTSRAACCLFPPIHRGGADGFLSQWRFEHDPVDALPPPCDTFHLVVFGEASLPDGLEHLSRRLRRRPAPGLRTYSFDADRSRMGISGSTRSQKSSVTVHESTRFLITMHLPRGGRLRRHFTIYGQVLSCFPVQNGNAARLRPILV